MAECVGLLIRTHKGEEDSLLHSDNFFSSLTHMIHHCKLINQKAYCIYSVAQRKEKGAQGFIIFEDFKAGDHPRCIALAPASAA